MRCFRLRALEPTAAPMTEITTKIGNHTFRATGVTAYLKNGGTPEKAAQMASHASTRTTLFTITDIKK
jgi:integrase